MSDQFPYITGTPVIEAAVAPDGDGSLDVGLAIDWNQGVIEGVNALVAIVAAYASSAQQKLTEVEGPETAAGLKLAIMQQVAHDLTNRQDTTIHMDDLVGLDETEDPHDQKEDDDDQ